MADKWQGLARACLRRAAAWAGRYLPRRGSVAAYALAAGLMAIALLLRLAAAPPQAGLPYPAFFPALTLAAIVGGFGAGMFAVFVGMVMAAFIFVPPFYSFSLQSAQLSFGANMGFLGGGLIICAAVAAMRQYQLGLELEELYDKAPCGYHSLDSEGRIIRINRTEAEWLGYPREELIGRKITDFHAPASAQLFAADFSRFKRVGFVGTIEVELVRRDGTRFTALLSSRAVYDAQGNYLKNRTTMVDITARKQIETALVDSEERFRQLFEKAPIGIAMARQDQKIFAANAAFCTMFGYSSAELSQLTITDLTHADYIDKTRELATGLLEGEMRTYSLDKKYLRKSGETFWGRVIATEVVGGDSRGRYIMGIVEDVSDRVAREESRLSAVREQRDLLVREVHHRIKNNLQGVVGLLRQHVSEHPELAGAIEVALSRIYSIAIIHGLQARELTEEVNLDSLLKSILDAGDPGVDYVNVLQQPVLLDRDEAVPIALVLNELLTNARKHRSAHSPVIVRLQSGAGDTTTVNIANYFDVGREAEAGGGQGLNLIRSLLPRQAASLTARRIENIYQAELVLQPPVTLPKRD